jgi:hypothetical protein
MYVTLNFIVICVCLVQGVKHATRQFIRSVRIVAESAYYFNHACLCVRIYQRGFHWRDFREIQGLYENLSGGGDPNFSKT